MAIRLRESRPRRGARASIREVCLVSGEGPAPGGCLEWGGRAYRVEEAQGPYLHLSPAGDEPGRGEAR